MKTSQVFLLLTLLSCALLSVHSQVVTTGVPFLLIAPSTEANGMGGIMGSGTPTSSSSMMSNPAQLGMLSRDYTFSSDFYRHKTNWLPSFRLSDLWLNSYSAMYGVSFEDMLPLNPSIGFGFSRVYLNLGEFVRTDDRGNEIGRFKGYEYVNNYSLGVSIDIGVQAAFGFTHKQILSHLSDFGVGQERGSGEANVTATDIGVTVKAPLYHLLTEENSTAPIFPFVDLSGAYAVNNLGDKIYYVDEAQNDPLPRTARIGWTAEAGLDITYRNAKFNFFRVSVAREAEDLLVGRDTSSWWYNGLTDDMDVYRSMVKSENYGNVSIRRGFSLSVFETFTYRQGSYAWDGNLTYQTNGTSISTKGLFKAIGNSLSDEHGFNLTKYLLEHFEIRFSDSKYTGHDIVGSTSFKNIVIALHQ